MARSPSTNGSGSACLLSAVPTRRHQFNGRHEQIGRPLLSSGENLTLIERLMLTEENTLMYEYTVKDPTIWVSDWTAQHP